jgi:hypothetical protein
MLRIAMSIAAKLKRLRTRPNSAASLMDAAREWYGVAQEGEALLGKSGWTLMRGYGRMMSGPHSGQYVSALPVADVRVLLQALQRGEKVPVHLMHRHRSGCYEASSLSFASGRLLMHYLDRSEPADEYGCLAGCVNGELVQPANPSP